jgi:uncharacterized protein (TIGR02246 family)
MPFPAHDIVEIGQLAVRYAHAIDAGDGLAFASVFTEDGRLVIDGKPPIIGHSALAQFAVELPNRLRRSRHVITNLLVDGEGNNASLVAYVQVFARRDDGSEITMVTAGTYDDVLVRTNGRWLFVDRKFSAD